MYLDWICLGIKLSKSKNFKNYPLLEMKILKEHFNLKKDANLLNQTAKNRNSKK